MTLWQEYAAMRPFEDKPPKAAATTLRSKVSEGEMSCLRFFLQKIAEVGKKVEEQRSRVMLQAKERSLLDPQPKIAVQKYQPKPRRRPLDPRFTFVMELYFTAPHCVVCGEPATCKTSNRWVCLNHLNAVNTI